MNANQLKQIHHRELSKTTSMKCWLMEYAVVYLISSRQSILIRIRMSEMSDQDEKSHFSMCIDEIWGERLRKFLQQFLSGYAESGGLGYKSVCVPDIYKLMCNGTFLGNYIYDMSFRMGCAILKFFQ